MTTEERLTELALTWYTDQTPPLFDIVKAAYNMGVEDAASEAETDYDMANVNQQSILKLLIK